MSLAEFNALPDKEEVADGAPAPRRRCPADEALAACLGAAAMLIEYDRMPIIRVTQVRKVLSAIIALGDLTREAGGATAWGGSAVEADSATHKRLNAVRKHWLLVKESMASGAFDIALQWMAVASYEAACARRQVLPPPRHWTISGRGIHSAASGCLVV
ncbi:MAG: hypothetical protein LDL44_01860 [Caenispirillum sp.]|nr:hypothetical protein [Caenispirillum sp.]